MRNGGGGAETTSIFSKATFSATGDDLDDIDIDDPNFWERWARKMNVDPTTLANASGAGSADEPRIKRQLKRIRNEDLEIPASDSINIKKFDYSNKSHVDHFIHKFTSLGIKGIQEISEGYTHIIQ